MAWPSEAEIIGRIRRRAGRGLNRGLLLGIGDDCAIFRARGAAEDLLFTSDMVLEGVHFRPQTHGPEDVGHQALARGLSDIAAMGGAPRFCLVSLALALWADDSWVDGFYGGLLRLARRTGTALAGGDLARAERLACDVLVCGSAPKGGALRRDGARPGDGIYVSGRLGGSALGLASGTGAAWKRHLRAQPRLALGRFLREDLRATACMDLSDGLSLDLRRMCLASGLAADIAPPPRYPGASPDQALHGGEDYELLFTLAGKATAPKSFRRLMLTRIGTMRKGRAGEVRMEGAPIEPRGWDPFAPAGARRRPAE